MYYNIDSQNQRRFPVKRTKVVTVRLTPNEHSMLDKLSTPKKPKSEVLRSLIKKAYMQEAS